MHGLRSRAGLAATTVGALALLSVPVVALAKGQPQDPGGGQNHAGQNPPEAQAPDPGPKATPPGQTKSEPPGQAKPAPSGQARGRSRVPAPADDGPAARAPSHAGGGDGGRAPAGNRPATSHGGAPPRHTHVPPGHAKKSAPHKSADGSSEPPSPSGDVAPSGGSAGEPAGGHSAPDSTGAPDLPSAGSPGEDGGVAGAVESETVELPEDASPATLPFTGLQLALLALIGLATAAAGLLVRQRA